MAKKKKTEKPVEKMDQNTHILGAGEVLRQNITDTLETNYMPYAMSVILSRAIPEIDGFKPSHRKLLYTMYKMGLINGARTKSANIVGQTMKLNPHGDAAIYDTMVRLSRGYEALLHPFVDSKGNFGKAYSRDMQWAAPRYTEAKLAPICTELFAEIDKDTVDFVDNYDNTMKEPSLLPVRFPSILANPTTGIAVGMASSICPFNLRELCETTIALIKDPEADISETLKAPDFAGGGLLLYDRDVIDTIYKTGRGGFKIRAKYNYDKDGKCIDITEIPPTTTAEAIIDKVIEKFKSGSLREISDIRDETDKSGLKITIDLKKGTDPDKLMQKLYKATPLEDTFSCNFNVLIAGAPRVMGVGEILNEWIAFRTECVKRRVYFDLSKAKDKLHLLEGLQKILLDIDKAIKIIRSTEEESEVVPNLMIGFGIDEIQANYVAEIKLRHLNREYILKRTQDIEQLRADIEKMEDILAHKSKIKKILVNELTDVVNKYGQDRKTRIIFASEVAEEETEEEIPDFPVNLFFSKEGKHIVCGGTTSSIAAKYLGKPVRATLNFEQSDVPPIAEIEGVDLVTEGVITINKVIEYAKDALSSNELYDQWSIKQDGASRICRLLFEEATDINFYVGRAVNPAHQNPDLPINFNIKMNLVEELSSCLKQMGKRIKVSYF